jgi:glycosyltransferase involved in cell wall biosynthesis
MMITLVVVIMPNFGRGPIWDKYATQFQLKVWFLSKRTNWREWNLKGENKWTPVFLSYFMFRISEIELFISLRRGREILDSSELIVLQGWEAPLYIRLAVGAKKRNIPFLIFYESTSNSHNFNNAIVRFVRSRVLNLANFIVTSGRDSTNAVLSMGISESKIVTLFNPVDVTWFKDNVLKYRTSGLPGHKFLYVGQLIKRKNISSLVRAFGSMRQPEDTLSIVGEGILENDLKALVQELGLQSSVFFLGSITAMQFIQR